MRRQASPLRAADTVLAVKLHVERVIDVAAGADRNADAIVEHRVAASIRCLRLSCLRLVQLEANLAEIVELRDGTPLDFGLDTAFQDAIEEGIYVGFLGEIEQAPGIIGRLHFLKTGNDLPEQREGCKEANLELSTTKG